jgi:hypothetical protein
MHANRLAGWLAAAVIAVNCPGNVSGSEDSARQDTQSGTVTAVPLEYQETTYQFLFRDIPIERRSVPFPKEPAPAPGNLIRGVLKFGDGPRNAVPFLWQSGARKLFLDLNRNQDLTGDPAGVFSGRSLWTAGPNIINQIFTNIHMSFPASSAGAPILMDLRFSSVNGTTQLICNAAVRSFWQGKATVAGHDWQVGLVQNMSDQPGAFQRGQLLLRPCKELDRPFSAWCEPADTRMIPWEPRNWVVRASDAFAFSPKVFFDGHAWQLDWSAEPQSREEKLVLRMTEQQPALGELRITGSFIQRLVLTGEQYMVVLAEPPASVKVPVGRYSPFRVRVKQGRTEAYFNYGLPQSGKANVMDESTGAKLPVLSPPPPDQAVAVDEQRPAVMAVGGPLTNCVFATRHGRDLLLSYRLIGAGGKDYRILYGEFTGEPQFTVRKGGIRIASGKFEFG